MQILDLFSGLGGWNEAFKERGHKVYTLDINPIFEADFICDIRDFHENLNIDVILASPPCNKLSLLQKRVHWDEDLKPRTEEAIESMRIIEETLRVIEELNPKYFIIENPVGVLRKLPILSHLERRYITYCQYGFPFMKPTDLWGGFPETLILRPPCKKGDNCHLRAKRGLAEHKKLYREVFKETYNDRLAWARAKVPYQLSLEVCLATERAINEGSRTI